MSVKVPPMSIPSEYWATSLLQPQVFRGRRVSVAGNQPRARLGLALLGVELAALAMVEIVDLRHAAVRIDPVPGDIGLETRRRIAERGRDDQDDAAELLLPPLGEVGGALHRARLRADADRLEIALDRLGHRVVGRERIEVAALEAVRVSRFRQ